MLPNPGIGKIVQNARNNRKAYYRLAKLRFNSFQPCLQRSFCLRTCLTVASIPFSKRLIATLMVQ